MATIRIVGDNWVLNWMNEVGKQQRRVIGKTTHISKREADMILKAKELELHTRTRILNLPGIQSETFDDFQKEFIEWYASEYPSTYPSRRASFTRYQKHFGDKPLADITEADIEAYKHTLLLSMKPSSASNDMALLGAMFRRARLWKRITHSPMDNVAKPKPLEDNPPLFYTLDELERIYATGDRGAIWRLYANTGMRVSEGLALRWEDVTEHHIRVISRASRATKTRKWRQIPLGKGARRALDELRNDTPYVLPQLRRHSLSASLDRVLKKLSLPGSIHTLRHTFASHLVMQGTRLRTVQLLLGHSTITTTEIYAHLSPDHLRQSVAELDL